MYEHVLSPLCQHLLVLDPFSTEGQQVERLMQRNDFPEEEARRRIAAQIPLAEKAERADYVIDNAHSLEETQKQVTHIYYELKSLSWWCGLHRWLVLLLWLFIVMYAMLMV